MKISSKWVENKLSVITNGRGHGAIVDLPEAKKGQNSSYTALEMCLMSLGGCITTIYSVIAENKKITLYDIKLDIEAEQDEKTISSVHVNIDILTTADEKQAKRVFKNTMETCPVGIIFERAGIDMDYTVEVHHPDSVK